MNNFFKKVVVGSAIVAGLSYVPASYATVLTDAQTAITGASADALTVGGYVVAAVAGLVVISLILSMIKKL